MDGLDFIHNLINRFKPPKTKEEIHHEELLKSFGLEYDDDEYDNPDDLDNPPTD